MVVVRKSKTLSLVDAVEDITSSSRRVYFSSGFWSCVSVLSRLPIFVLYNVAGVTVSTMNSELSEMLERTKEV